MRLRAKRVAVETQPNHWNVLHELLKIDPAPVIGDTWLDGVADGIYQAQCYLSGRAQGQASRGDYAAAVETAKVAVSLNGNRRFMDDEESA